MPSVRPRASGEPDTSLQLPKGPTVEAFLYIALLLLTLGLRLYHLGRNPLEAGEGLRALAAWELVVGRGVSSWQEPLPVLSTALLFFLFGDNDFTARLAPALFGTALVGMPWLLRRELGGVGALLAALFLALSPAFLYYSRFLSGQIFAAALSLSLTYAFFRYLEQRRPFHLLLGAALLALLLNTGAMGISFSGIFLSFLLLSPLLERGHTSSSAAAALGDRELLSKAGLLFLAVFLLTSTGFLLYPGGLGLPALLDWVRLFELSGRSQPWHYQLQLLAAYEPLALLWGLLGAGLCAYRWWEKRSFDPLDPRFFLIFWAGGALLLLTLAGGMSPGEVLAPLLPLTLIAGAFAADLLNKLTKATLLQAGGLLVALMPPLVFLFLLLSQLTSPGAAPLMLERALVVLGLVVIFGILAAQAMQGSYPTALALNLVGLPLFLLLSLHSVWASGYNTSAGEFLAPSPSSRQLSGLVEELKGFSDRPPGAGVAELVVDVRLKGVLTWYLRKVGRVSYREGVPEPAPEALLWMGVVQEPTSEGYQTSRFRLEPPWTLPFWDAAALWRWWVYREPFARGAPKEIVFYWKK